MTECLDRVASITMGQSPDSKYYSNEEVGLPFLQGCAQFKERTPQPILFCSQAKKVASTGSILISVRAPVGKTNIADRDYVIGRGLAGILATGIDQGYLSYYLSYIEPTLRAASQGSTFEAINSGELNNWPIQFPGDQSEQAKIAEILSTVDRAIEQTEALIAKQQRIKTGLMQDLLTRGIDEQGNFRSEETHEFKDSPLGRIPVEWEIQPCIALCREIVVGIVIRPAQYYRSEGVPVLRSANIKENQITTEDLVFMSDKDNETLSKSRLRTGDLVTVRTGYPGTTSVVPPELDGSNCVDIVISRPNHEKIRSEFLSIWVNSEYGKRQVLEGQGGLAQQHFNVREMRSLMVKTPDKDEQTRIEDLLMLQHTVTGGLIDKLEKLRSLKTALMQDLLTGKVRVTSLLRNSAY